jgi:hypothetical protein
MQPEMWAYLAGVCRNEKMVSVAIGGVADHVHLLFHLPPMVSLSKAISVLKSNSSRWMNERGIKFAWQEGYGAFSVSASNLATEAGTFATRKGITRNFSLKMNFSRCSGNTKSISTRNQSSDNAAPAGLVIINDAFPALTRWAT